MNALERTLIEKAGYDNGWEVVIESVPGQVVLASALHRARAFVITDTKSGKWLLTVPCGSLTEELARAEPAQHAHDNQFRAANDNQLGRLLNHASRLARSLPDLPEIRFAAAVAKELSAGSITTTEVERLVRQRVGQDIYRETLLDYWGGACAVTGIVVPELLRASHAKPWSECTSDSERLNVYNGFLLAAHLDALFDRFLLTFDDSGQAIFAPSINEKVRSQLGLFAPQKLRWLSTEHQPFLTWHRTRFQAFPASGIILVT